MRDGADPRRTALGPDRLDRSPLPLPPPSSLLPDLRKGEWAGRFSLEPGFYGVGALLFTSPRAAWGIDVTFAAEYNNYPTDSLESKLALLRVGRRWYGAANARVRPFGGAGVLGVYERREDKFAWGTYTYERIGGGAYGEFGAAIFFSPDLSLGAKWGADLTTSTYTGTDDWQYEVSVGHLALEGAFYF
jgi:hypothetical protein